MINADPGKVGREQSTFPPVFLMVIVFSFLGGGEKIIATRLAGIVGHSVYMKQSKR